MTLRIAALLFFMACSGYGLLQVHVSSDTWLGMALGREILESREFPVTDSSSYTRAGEVSFNQNWLTHAIQYFLYREVGPAAVVLFSWLLAAGSFAMVFLACFWRTRAVSASLVAAGMVGFACRDFLSPRPATTGIFCVAALWGLIQALERRNAKHRWWPVGLILPLLLFWGHAHGSFVFGFGTLGLYLVWSLFRLWWERPGPDPRQCMGIGLVLAGAALSTALLSPFGHENLIHGLKIVGSDIFREASEWRPPFTSGGFPPVWRFWTVLGLGVVVALFAAAQGRVKSAGSREAVPPGLFDLAMIGLSLYMTLWARRFAPLLLILAAPAMLAWIVSRIAPGFRLQRVLTGVVALGALSIGFATAVQARIDLAHRPGDLLRRVTRFDKTPVDALRYLRRNEVEVNLWVELTQAGQLLFEVPRARVFIDGRAQQLYFDEDKLRYKQVLLGLVPPHQVLQILDDSRTEAVLLRPRPRTRGLYDTLSGSDRWSPVLLGEDHTLFMRHVSRPMEQLGQRLRSGTEWRPETARAAASRGLLWVLTSPPDLPRAVQSWNEAVDRDITTGGLCFKPLTRGWIALGRFEEARRATLAWSSAVRSASGMGEPEREELLRIIDDCRQMIEGASG